MAVDDHLPAISRVSIGSASSSASASPTNERRQRLVQVATDNSSTFIPFPCHPRQSFSFVPVSRPRASLSSARISSPTGDAHSVSNQSKGSVHLPEQQRSRSQQRTNPILDNPLLNHRKQQVKESPPKLISDVSLISRLCLSSKPFKTALLNGQIMPRRANTAPLLLHPSENASSASERLTPDDLNQQCLPYLDVTKHDYITRWLQDIRLATQLTDGSTPMKRSKKSPS